MKKRRLLLTLLAIGTSLFASAQTYATYNNGWANWGAAGIDEGYDVALDASDNLYTTGLFNGTVDFNPGNGTANLTSAGSSDIFVSKLDGSENYVWAFRIGGTGQDKALAITTDAAGDVYVGGQFSGTVDFDPGAGTSNLTSAGSFDAFVAKYTSAGAFVWVAAMSGPADQWVQDLKVASDGSVFAAGVYQQTPDADPGAGTSTLPGAFNNGWNGYVWKLTSAGALGAVAPLYSATDEAIYGLALRGSQVLAVGTFRNTLDFDHGAGTTNVTPIGARDAFFMTLNASDLSFVSVLTTGGTLNDQYNKIEVDAAGNAYLIGNYYGTIDMDPGAGTANTTSVGDQDFWITKLDASNTYKWGYGLGSAGTEDGLAVAVNNNGKIYYTGVAAGTIDYDPTAGVDSEPIIGMADWFILAMDSIGGYAGHNRYGSQNNDYAYAITTGSDARVMVTGSHSATMDVSTFNTFNLFTNGLAEAFIVRAIPYCAPADVPFPTAQPSTVCAGASTQLTVPNTSSLGGGTYWQWYEGNCGTNPIGQGATITVTPGSTITYWVQGEGGCLTQPSGCGQIQITVTPAPVIAISGDTSICAGESTTLTASATGATYAWQGGPNTAAYTVSPTQTTTYTVTASVGACSSTETQTVHVAPAPDLAITQNSHTLTVAQTGATYQWIDCGTQQPISGANSQSYTATTQGSYACTVTLGDCEGTSVCTTAGPVAITPGQLEGLRVYPNPAHDRLMVDASLFTASEFQLYNLLGERIAIIPMNATTAVIDLSNLSAGVYTYMVIAAEGVATGKLVKE